MTADYVLCVGGSGAKAGEALIHMLAAGMASEDLDLNFLDQDVTNGNLIKARGLADLYTSLQKTLRPGLAKVGNRWLFRARLNADGDAGIYPPVHPPFEKLGQLFERDLLQDEARHFFDSLYDRDREIDLELVHGFRGRPAIGQAVLAAGIDTGLPFWKTLDARIDYHLHNAVTSQKYFLMGSVFGGTGAAGVPTVASHVHKRLNPTLGDRRGTVGAALFLPYFKYPETDPRQEQASGRLLPSSTMIARARMALDYYRMEMDQSNRWAEGPPLDRPGQTTPKSPPRFDSLYIVGWPELIDLGYVASGGGVQDNPALLPELLAGLSALHFFQAKVSNDGSNGRVFRAGFLGDAIDWEDLPSPRSDVDSLFTMKPLATLVRFAFLYKHVYFEALFGEDKEKCRRQVWFENLIGSSDVIDVGVTATARDLMRYCDLLLRWVAALALHGQDPKCRIFDVSSLRYAEFTNERDESGGYLPRRIRLYEELDGRDKLMKGADDLRYLPIQVFRKDIEATFDHLVSWTPKLGGLGQIYKTLCTWRPENRRDRGFAAFLHALWIACAQPEGERL